MAKLIPVPKLGQSEETVTIVQWHKAEGDEVKKGDVLFEVETDKSVLEVESQFEGTLLKLVLEAGKEVPVMSVAAVIGKPGEAIPPIEQPTAAPAPAAPQASAPAAPKAAASPPAAPAVPQTVAAPVPATVAATPQRKAISPRARKFAGDFLIDLNDVPGTGPGDRVVERDVKAYLETSGYYDRKITPAAQNLARELGLSLLSLTPTGATGRVTISDVRRAEAEMPKAMSKMRQTIARRLQQSKQTMPHFYATVSVDMTDLIEFRKGLKEKGYTVSINDFVAKAVALTLVEFPEVNSTTDGLTASWNSHVNVGIAVSIDNGLVVPVVRDADEMPLDELHAVVRELADKARSGKMTPEDMSGGTFTISNMGMLGVENFAAIINPGESAILAVASAMPVPVVNEDREVVVRDMMKITVSVDHRLVDGATSVAFVNAVKAKLECVELWEEEIA